MEGKRFLKILINSHVNIPARLLALETRQERAAWHGQPKDRATILVARVVLAFVVGSKSHSF